MKSDLCISPITFCNKMCWKLLSKINKRITIIHLYRQKYTHLYYPFYWVLVKVWYVLQYLWINSFSLQYFFTKNLKHTFNWFHFMNLMCSFSSLNKRIWVVFLNCSPSYKCSCWLQEGRRESIWLCLKDCLDENECIEWMCAEDFFYLWL